MAIVSEEEKTTTWKGYKRCDFKVDGREAIIVFPHENAPGKPWVWRAEFFDTFAQADIVLLEKGWHLAYYRVSDMFGCPESIALMRCFQIEAIQKFGLAKRATLFGFSRGGLYAFNYAVKYPESVAAVYLDAPVLDIKSWPGGLGSGEGSPDEWQKCLKIYGRTKATIADFEGNPLDKISEALKARIPIVIVAGDSDRSVPLTENAAILAEEYSRGGGDFKYIVKPGVGHHPHSLDDPEPVVRFLTEKFYGYPD